jgi:hypothetical protein
MIFRKVNGERKYSQESVEDTEFGLERIMGYTISAIGLCLILLKILSSS